MELYDKAVSESALNSIKPQPNETDREILKSLTLAEARVLCDVSSVGHKESIDLTLFTVAAARHEAREIFKRAISKLLKQGLIKNEGQWYRPTAKGVEVAKDYLRTVGESLRAEANTSPAA